MAQGDTEQTLLNINCVNLAITCEDDSNENSKSAWLAVTEHYKSDRNFTRMVVCKQQLKQLYSYHQQLPRHTQPIAWKM